MGVPENTFLRVIPTFTLGTVSRAQNVYHFLHETAEEQEDDDVIDACGNLIDALMSELEGYISNTVDLEKVEIYIWESPDWNPLGVAQPTWAGTSAVEMLPVGCALQINLFKPRSGYSDKKYIAGYVEATQAGGVFIEGLNVDVVDYLALMTALYTDPNGVELRPVHVPYDRDTHQPLVAEYKSYLSGSWNRAVAYQRRRKQGVGLT